MYNNSISDLNSKYNTLNGNLINAQLQRTAGIDLKTSGTDSPEYTLTTSKYISRNDISVNNLRWFTCDADGQNLKFPLKLDLSTDKGYVFGKEIATVDTNKPKVIRWYTHTTIDGSSSKYLSIPPIDGYFKISVCAACGDSNLELFVAQHNDINDNTIINVKNRSASDITTDIFITIVYVSAVDSETRGID